MSVQVVCSSAYWSGGEMGPDGRISKSGDVGSRYSFAMISDDHGASWRIGSKQVQPYHTTESGLLSLGGRPIAGPPERIARARTCD